MTIREIVEEWQRDNDNRDSESLIEMLEMHFTGHFEPHNKILEQQFWEQAFIALLGSWEVNEAAERADDAVQVYRSKINENL